MSKEIEKKSGLEEFPFGFIFDIKRDAKRFLDAFEKASEAMAIATKEFKDNEPLIQEMFGELKEGRKDVKALLAELKASRKNIPLLVEELRRLNETKEEIEKVINLLSKEGDEDEKGKHN